MFFLSFFGSHQPAQIDQNQYEPVDRVEVAKLLGTSDINKAENKIEHVSPSENCEYAVVNKKEKKVSCELSMVKNLNRTSVSGSEVLFFLLFSLC